MNCSCLIQKRECSQILPLRSTTTFSLALDHLLHLGPDVRQTSTGPLAAVGLASEGQPHLSLLLSLSPPKTWDEKTRDPFRVACLMWAIRERIGAVAQARRQECSTGVDLESLETSGYFSFGQCKNIFTLQL